MKRPANVFFVTHKCGNHFFESVFTKDPTFSNLQSVDLSSSKQLPGETPNSLANVKGDFLNLRCRNFDPISILKLLKHLDPEKTRFFLVVRHPASFFRSASSYHVKSPERWSKNRIYKHLGDRTLNSALLETDNADDRLILTMKHFGFAWYLPQRWLMNAEFLKSSDLNFSVLKTEDLFTDGTASYFETLASNMSHDGYQIDASHLMNASPIFMKELPPHSTGEFRKSSFDGYGDKALSFYNQHFKSLEQYFYLS